MRLPRLDWSRVWFRAMSDLIKLSLETQRLKSELRRARIAYDAECRDHRVAETDLLDARTRLVALESDVARLTEAVEARDKVIAEYRAAEPIRIDGSAARRYSPDLLDALSTRLTSQLAHMRFPWPDRKQIEGLIYATLEQAVVDPMGPIQDFGHVDLAPDVAPELSTPNPRSVACSLCAAPAWSDCEGRDGGHLRRFHDGGLYHTPRLVAAFHEARREG